MSMNTINSLPIPVSDNSVTRSENGRDHKGAFHRLLDEQKDQMTLNTDKEEDAIPLPSKAVEMLDKEDGRQDKKTDSEETDDFIAWFRAMELLGLPEKESAGLSSMTAAADFSQLTLLNRKQTDQLPALLTDDTMFEGKNIGSFRESPINAFSFENDTINSFGFKGAEVELMSRIPMWNRFSKNETPALMIHPAPAAALSSAASAPASIVSLSAPVNSPQWQELLGQQIVFFNRNDIHKAHIRLHPEELGSLHIQLEMQDGKMHMTLAALHSAVKGVLESAVPHLRISLAEQGIDLQSVHVNDDISMAFHQESSSSFHQSNSSPFHSKDTIETIQAEEKVTTSGVEGVSVFA